MYLFNADNIHCPERYIPVKIMSPCQRSIKIIENEEAAMIFNVPF
jgi:hypothetical protein